MVKIILVILCALAAGCRTAGNAAPETTPLPAAAKTPFTETKTVTLEGDSHTIAFEIPLSYTAEETEQYEAREVLVKDGDREIVSVGTGAFGVCGTGLEEKKIMAGGLPAIAGYYDGNEYWSFAVFRDTSPSVYVINYLHEGGSAEADLILQSIRIE